MAYVPNSGYYVESVLASAVTNTSTFTVGYPTGTTQATFDAGGYKEGSGHVMVNDLDKWTDTTSSGISFTTFGASDITLTNQTGATLAAGTKVKVWLPIWVGPPVEIMVPVFAMSGISAADVVTNIRPGIDGYIVDWQWVQGVPVTTAAKAATLNLEINSTNVTGGTISLTSAACTPLGARIAGTRITAANRITRADTLSVEASSVTAFVEGSGFLLIRIQPDIV